MSDLIRPVAPSPPSAPRDRRDDEDPVRGNRDRRYAALAGVRLTGLLARSRRARLLLVEDRGVGAALKIAAAGPSDGQRFDLAREGGLGLGLRHPHLVETLRHGCDWILLRDPGGRGPSTDSLLRRIGEAGPFPCAVVEGFVGKVADALAYLHARGLAHRDVTPGNILVTAAGEPIVIDLGSAGPASGGDAELREIVGAPAWLAPEQLLGQPASAASDVWSLALVALFALTGTKAYEGTATRVLERRRAGDEAMVAFCRAALDQASDPFRSLLAAGLAIDPQARPPVRAFARLGDSVGS